MSGQISGISDQDIPRISCHLCGTGIKKNSNFRIDEQPGLKVDVDFLGTPPHIRVLGEKERCRDSGMLTGLVIVLSLLVLTLLFAVAVLKSRMDSFQGQLDSLLIHHHVLQEKLAQMEGLPLQAPSTVGGSQNFKNDARLLRIVRNAGGIKKHVNGRNPNKRKTNNRGSKSKNCTNTANGNSWDEIEKYCERKISNQPGKQLESVEFEGNFFTKYNFSDFGKHPCHIDEAHHCNVCRHASVEYFNKYSPLHVYRPRNDTSSLVKMKDSTTFETLTSGSYLLHLDIVMIDEDQNHSIGIFVNKKTVLACPRGGFLLPQDKADILKYRICNIDGLVTLKAGDNLQIRTMDAHTTVRLEPTQVSLFKFILLHKMTANSPNKS